MGTVLRALQENSPHVYATSSSTLRAPTRTLEGHGHPEKWAYRERLSITVEEIITPHHQ